MDYLLRDSHHAGVDYGRFDWRRLVQTIEAVPGVRGGSPALGVSEGGLHAAEGLILARYFMFTQVYFHKTRVVYDHHLKEALKEILPGGRFPPPTGERLDEYLDWDDWRVLGALKSDEGGEHGRAGRTALMKFVYFLKELKGVPFDYRFTLHTYGPFDSRVLDDLSYARLPRWIPGYWMICMRGRSRRWFVFPADMVMSIRSVLKARN